MMAWKGPSGHDCWLPLSLLTRRQPLEICAPCLALYRLTFVEQASIQHCHGGTERQAPIKPYPQLMKPGPSFSWREGVGTALHAYKVDGSLNQNFRWIYFHTFDTCFITWCSHRYSNLVNGLPLSWSFMLHIHMKPKTTILKSVFHRAYKKRTHW